MKIVKKEIIAKNSSTKIIKLEVYSPQIAKESLAGQFVVVMVYEVGERIPLTIVDKDRIKGTITLIAQKAGFTTHILGDLNVGESFYALAGPLGHPTKIKKYGRVILVGGGVGIAEIYPVAKALKEKENTITTILGARNKDSLILKDELKDVSDEIHICTDDGSAGKKGFTTDILSSLINDDSRDDPCKLIYAVGPIPMMEKVAILARNKKIKSLASLNALMVDATGMCGCCRVTVGGKVKFACVDGPEFDSSLIDWDELKKRSGMYRDKENHICKLNIQ